MEKETKINKAFFAAENTTKMHNRYKKEIVEKDQYSVYCRLPGCDKKITGRTIDECDRRLQDHYYFKHRGNGI